jgi:hypothetical protein
MMGRTIKPKSGESRGAPGNARSVAANRDLTGRHLGSRAAAKFGVTVNINRQLRFVATIAMLSFAGSALHEVARADERRGKLARKLDSASAVRGLKPTITIEIPIVGSDLYFTNSPNLRLSGQLDSLGQFQLVGTNANWLGSYFHIEVSTNLVNWNRIGSIYPGYPQVIGNGFVFTDAGSTGSSRRYYRVIDYLLNVSATP